MSLLNLHLVQAELDRLVAWATTDVGVRVAVRAGDRVRFVYRGRERLGVVIGVSRGGFRLVEDGVDRPKTFLAERVSGFELLVAEPAAV